MPLLLLTREAMEIRYDSTQDAFIPPHTGEEQRYNLMFLQAGSIKYVGRITLHNAGGWRDTLSLLHEMAHALVYHAQGDNMVEYERNPLPFEAQASALALAWIAPKYRARATTLATAWLASYCGYGLNIRYHWRDASRYLHDAIEEVKRQWATRDTRQARMF